MYDWPMSSKEREEQKRKAREHFKRTCRAWPIITTSTVLVGGIAFFAFDATLGIFSAILALIASVLIVEHFVADPFIIKD